MSENEAGSQLAFQIGIVVAEAVSLKAQLAQLAAQCKRIPDCKELPRIVLAMSLVEQTLELLSDDQRRAVS